MAEKTLKTLTLEEKVGQLLQVRYYADYSSLDRSVEYRKLREAVRRYHIGSPTVKDTSHLSHTKKTGTGQIVLGEVEAPLPWFPGF